MTATKPTKPTKHTQPRTDQGLLAAPKSSVGAAQTPSNGHTTIDTQEVHAVGGPELLASLATSENQAGSVGEELNPEPATRQPIPIRSAPARALNSDGGQTCIDDRTAHAPVAPTSPATNGAATTIPQPSPGSPNSGTGQNNLDVLGIDASAAPIPPALARVVPLAKRQTPALVAPDETTERAKVLAMFAETVNDLEKARIAFTNRLEVMTRVGPDKDGKVRGLGWLPIDPTVCQFRVIVEAFQEVEAKATASLIREFEEFSPLAPWVKAQPGLGPKTMARLLGVIGDPYWNGLHHRPRTVAELRSYCGYGQPGQLRRKGEKLHFSPAAKTRLHVAAEGALKIVRDPCYVIYEDPDKRKGYIQAVHFGARCRCPPYRVLYDQARDKYRDSLHPDTGLPRTAKHLNFMAYRIVKKRILRDLWQEAKRLHDLDPPATNGDATSIRESSPGT